MNENQFRLVAGVCLGAITGAYLVWLWGNWKHQRHCMERQTELVRLAMEADLARRVDGP